MHRQRVRFLLRLAPLFWLAASAAADDPLVDTPPPPEDICPAIAEDYELCRADATSGNCPAFVSAAHALGRLYLFNVQRQPERKEEFLATVWWQCGSATFAELKALLLRIDSPDARAVLAEAPYRSLPAPAAARTKPEAAAGAPGATAATQAPADCAATLAPAEREACQQKALQAARSHHQSEVARCESTLPAFMATQFRTAENAWQNDQENECLSADGPETGCLLESTQQRNQALAADCGFGGPEQPEPLNRAEEGGLLGGGPQTGMLPARWTPPHGGAPQEVTFSFENRGLNTVQGTMETTLGKDGERFEGNYLRIQESTRGKLVTAMSVGWSGPEWELWQHEPDGAWVQEGVSVGEFAHFYTGKVLAHLRGDRDHAMRCQIVLKEPEAGLLHGGSGRCQVTDGGSLTLDF